MANPTKDKLDHNVDRITDLTTIIRILERRLEKSKDNPALKNSMIKVLNQYEVVRKETIDLLDEYITEETKAGNVTNFNYRMLRKRLTS
jgi:hypothetical protein